MAAVLWPEHATTYPQYLQLACAGFPARQDLPNPKLNPLASSVTLIKPPGALNEFPSSSQQQRYPMITSFLAIPSMQDHQQIPVVAADRRIYQLQKAEIFNIIINL